MLEIINQWQFLTILEQISKSVIFYLWLCWGFVAACGLLSSGGQGLLSSREARASDCSGFFCCAVRALGTWAPGHVGSVLVSHGLSCSVVHEIFPDQGSNPCPLH